VSTNLKQVILIRRDLRLKRALVASLAARASAAFFIDNDVSDHGDQMIVPLSSLEATWLSGPATRIVLGVSSEDALNRILMRAQTAGISTHSIEGRPPNASVLDEKGDDVEQQLMCASLGPDESDRLDEITGNLKLI